MENSLNFLSSREGFNVALRHFKGVTSIIKLIGTGKNLADIINAYIENKKIQGYQASPIINALLVDKYAYHVKSFNLKKTFTDPLVEIAQKMKSWKKFDIILTYFHPQLGLIVINPKDENSWEATDNLRENELVVAYVGNYDKEFNKEEAKKCANIVEKILNSEKVTEASVKSFYTSETPSDDKVVSQPEKEVVKKAAPVQKKESVSQPASKEKTEKPTGKKKISPQYGVIVTNELFHNGNVEAWKKIIASYETKYSGIKVLIFYEGEQIHDINALFKWGKVKHGTNIYFALLGVEFKDISKLRRYLAQGASSRFEDFLKGEPTKVLSLF